MLLDPRLFISSNNIVYGLGGDKIRGDAWADYDSLARYPEIFGPTNWKLLNVSK